MFSELVDICVARSVRPERKADTISFANQTVREMVVKYGFSKNLIEDTLYANADPYIWPRPARLQRVRTVRYDSNVFPTFIQPGKAQEEYVSRYYAASTYFAFKNCGDQNNTIDIAYYQFPKRLNYYNAGSRPAVYDFQAETWTYLPAYDVDDTTRQTAQDLVSNWLLRDWFDLICEGVLAKIFKVIDDNPRAGTHYSYFQRNYVEQFLATEVHESFDK